MTPVFQSFVAPARARPELWRLFLGLVLTVAVYMAWVALVFLGIWWLFSRDVDPTLWATEIGTMTTAEGAFVVLLTFLGMALGPMAAARWLHRRAARTLFGPAARTLRHFVVAAFVYGCFLGLSMVPWSTRFDALPNVDPVTWLRLLPLAILLILIQTGAEELLFRGYLQQQLAARFRSAVVWLILPALLFGLVHYNPPGAGPNTLFVIAAAGLFGLIAGDLTARTGSIGAAWGMHFANNFFAMAVISTQGTITGLSLFVTPYSLSNLQGHDWLLLGNLFLVVLGWSVVRRLVGR